MLHRRGFLKSAAGAPFAAVLASPELARAAAAGLETVTLTTAGGRSVSGALARPAAAKAPAVLLVHEWWGLNDQIKATAAEFAKAGYLALAVDLYDGTVATSPDQARATMQKVVGAEATDTLVSWAGWLRAHEASAGPLGTVGWCFGGGWSLRASMATPVEATIVYYGNVRQPADKLAGLKGPVLGHFATLDRWINKEMVDGFEAEMAKAGRPLTVHWYEADHAFANPSGGRYDEADAKLSWQRSLEFFATHLKG